MYWDGVETVRWFIWHIWWSESKLQSDDRFFLCSTILLVFSLCFLYYEKKSIVRPQFAFRPPGVSNKPSDCFHPFPIQLFKDWSGEFWWSSLFLNIFGVSAVNSPSEDSFRIPLVIPQVFKNVLILSPL